MKWKTLHFHKIEVGIAAITTGYSIPTWFSNHPTRVPNNQLVTKLTGLFICIIQNIGSTTELVTRTDYMTRVNVSLFSVSPFVDFIRSKQTEVMHCNMLRFLLFSQIKCKVWGHWLLVFPRLIGLDSRKKKKNCTLV